MLRFWNNEVLDNPEGARAAIADALHQVSPSPIRPVTPTRIEPLTPTHTLPHRGGRPEATTTEDPADSKQLIADLQRQLAECRAERDAGLQQESATRLTHPPARWGRAGVGVMPRTEPW